MKNKLIFFCCPLMLICSCGEEKPFATASLDIKNTDFTFEDIVTGEEKGRIDILIPLKIDLRDFTSKIKASERNTSVFYSTLDSGDEKKIKIFYFEKIDIPNGRISLELGDSLINSGLTCSQFELSFIDLANYTTT